MIDKFDQLLQDLAEKLDVDLNVDVNNSCMILVEDKLEVQLELDKMEENLLVLAFICKIPPGKFRENVLKEALKQNDKIDRLGDFAYSEMTNQLIHFKYLPLEIYNTDKILDFLAQFLDLSLLYKNAVESGYALPNELITEGDGSKNPFGLK